MPAASFKYSNNPLHERGERGTPPSSPLRFGAFALGQQADMRLVRCAHFAQMPPLNFYFEEAMALRIPAGRYTQSLRYEGGNIPS